MKPASLTSIKQNKFGQNLDFSDEWLVAICPGSRSRVLEPEPKDAAMDQPEHTFRSADRAGQMPFPGSSGSEAGPRAASRLTLVSGRLQFADPAEPAPAEWAEAIADLLERLDVDAVRVSQDKPTASLMERAKRAIAANGAARTPVYAPWQSWSPASFQHGARLQAAPRAQWVASYLHDCGAGRPVARNPLDIMLMSPLPEECSEDDPQVGPVPRLGVMNAMLRAAAAEGREKVTIIVRAGNRNAIASRLVAADCPPSGTRPDFDILAIEEAVVRLQRGMLDAEAIIALPDLRAIVFAMLAEMAGVAGPWPMLWHDRDLVCVTGEAIDAPAMAAPLDAALLMQSLALLARRTGCTFAAERVHKAWAALRERGVVTPSRGSPAPYVNAVADRDFLALASDPQQEGGRRLPGWKAIAPDRTERPVPAGAARLSLVSSR